MGVGGLFGANYRAQCPGNVLGLRHLQLRGYLQLADADEHTAKPEWNSSERKVQVALRDLDSYVRYTVTVT